MRNNAKLFLGIFSTALICGLVFYLNAQAFNGPTQTPPNGAGTLGSGSNTISVGTTTVASNASLLIVGSTTDSTAYGLEVLNSAGTALLTARNDGVVSVGTSTISGGAFAGTVSGGNISSGQFGSNTGGGNYSFPANLSVGTTTAGSSLEVNGDIKSDGPGINSANVLLSLPATNAVANIQFHRAGIQDWYLGSPASSPDLGFSYGSIGTYSLYLKNGGNVGIGLTTPDTPLSVNGTIQSQSSISNDYYNVISFTPGGGFQTGAVELVMPKFESDTMMQIFIKGYDYSGSGAWQVTIGGYNYTDNNWYNTSVQFSGRVPFSNVALGNNGSLDLLVLGNTSTTWSYGKIQVAEFIASHSNITGWGTGWSASLLTSLSGLTLTPLTPDMAVSTLGNVGIGTTAASTSLQVVGTNSTIRIGSASLPGCLEMGSASGTAKIVYVTFDSNAAMMATTTKPSACQ